MNTKLFPVFFVVIVISISIFFSVTTVPTGYIGVETLFGKVNGSIADGLHFINPLSIVYKMSIRTKEYTMSTVKDEGRYEGDDSIEALTADGLKIRIDATIFHKLNPEKVLDIFGKIGRDYEEIILRPVIRESIRSIASQYLTRDIYGNKREAFSQDILNRIKNGVEKRGIDIENVLIRNIILPDQVTKSIEKKLAADQEAQAMEFVLDKARKEADRKVIEAKGIRESQEIISKSLNQEYLKWYSIEMMKSLAGSPNTTFLFVPTDKAGMPIVNINGK